MIGHTLGRPGALEAAITAMSVYHGYFRHHQHPDARSDCDLDYIPREAREAKSRPPSPTPFGFGGHNCVLCFAKV